MTKDYLIVRSDDKTGFKLYLLKDWEDSYLKTETSMYNHVSFLSVIPETKDIFDELYN